MPLSSGYIEANFSKTWGVSPGGGSALLPDDASGSYAPGDEIVLNLGARTFHGMVTGVSPSADGAGGTFTRLELADNRIHLQMDITKCVWNMTEVRADNPATPGIDRQRRYWSIPTDRHPAQDRLWTDSPFNAADVIDDILNDADVEFVWSVSDPDGLLDAPVYEIDANNGNKLGAVLSEICSQLGILFTVTGYNTLLFARKGTGDVPYIAPSQQAAWSSGSALSHADTRIEVVGGRNVYQDVVTLEPWWNPNYQSLVVETDWLLEVEAWWGDEWAAETDLEVKRLRRAIKSREVTVREYAAKADIPGLTNLSDFGMWGEVCRMEMPVWRYLSDIVWRAFRVPRSYTLSFIGIGEVVHTLGVDSLLFHDHLLAACTYDATEGDVSRLDPPQWYPPEQAFIIAQGFRVNVLDPRLVKCLTPEELARARTVWAPQSGFTIDPRPESLGVIFDTSVVVDSVAHPFFKCENRGKDGITSTHPLYNVVVPNMDGFRNATAPAVKMAIAWQANKYLKVFGTGMRRGVAQSDGIAGHYITRDGVVTDEVPYADGDGVDTKAAEFAAKLIGQQEQFDMGTIRRVGGAGTELNGVVDRVEVRIERVSPGRGGLVEDVTLTKERVPVGHFNSRLLDRFARFHDLFSGQRANRTWIHEKEATLQARRLAVAQEDAGRVVRQLQTAMVAVAGNVNPGMQLISSAGALAPGQVMWQSAVTAALDVYGTIFAGVVTAAGITGASESVAVATQGLVPVRVKGPFKGGDRVGVNGSNDYAEPNGKREVGTVQVDYSGTDTVLAPVGIAPQPSPFRREFDISVLSHSGLTVKVMDGTWMGIRQTGATDAGTPGAYHTLTVANGDKIYLKLDYHELTSAGTLDILAGATVPTDVPSDGLFYRQLATVSVASGLISTTQTLWGPLQYSGRYQHLREFDVSPLRDSDPSVRIMAGTWMGIKGTGGFFSPGRGEYFTLYVAHGDTVYVKLDRGAGTLTYHAGATVPGSSPELGRYYKGLATVSIVSGRVSASQLVWGPLEYLPPYNDTFPLDGSSSATAHTDYWANYKPYDHSGVLRNGYNAVTWGGDRYYQSTVGTITISGTTLHIIETLVFSRTETTDSNGGTSDISAEFLKKTLRWLSDTAV